MSDLAFVNGLFLPLSEARVSVEDRGFQFGDGIYELLRSYRGQLFRPAEHLARLERSAAALKIPLPYSRERWIAVLSEAVTRSGYPDAKVYVQVTRGVAPRDHAPPPELIPTVVITVRAFAGPAAELYTKGVTVITVPDIRWARCDIKAIGLLPNILAKQQARAAGAFEALFVRDGFVLEGSTTNLMMVKAAVLLTPPEGPLLLSGVTRQVVLALAREAGIPVKEQAMTKADLERADEVFLTGTTSELLPVVQVNDRPIGTSLPGALTGLLADRFKALYL